MLHENNIGMFPVDEVGRKLTNDVGRSPESFGMKIGIKGGVAYAESSDVPKTDYKNVFLVDFSPNIPIDNIPNLCKILSGQKVPGKLRVYYFETMNQTYFLENYETFIESKKNRIVISNESKLSNQSQYLLSCYQKKININGEKAKELKIIFDCFDNWDLDFQLYNHNCQHFSKYFVRRANNFMD
jgi:hypothetical protein